MMRSQKTAGPATADTVNRAQKFDRRLNCRTDFDGINRAALGALPALLARWLPDGRCESHEYVARNPRRKDRTLGSFKINLRTGRWADFATGDRGGDVISLAAFLFDLSQGQAARRMASMLGLAGQTNGRGNPIPPSPRRREKPRPQQGR